MRVSVVIPTFRRPDSLIRCVNSLLASERLPDEILVVARADDEATKEALDATASNGRSGPHVRRVLVQEPGHVPPIIAGAGAATGDVVAIIDDDITVPPGWLSKLARHFEDPWVGAVGGGNIVPGAPPPAPKKNAGQLTWFGHHSGNIASVREGGVREVVTVMECNWAWRRELLTSLDFDPVLNFDDASMYGLDLCLQARRRGFRILYDPAAAALHHMAPRDPSLDRADRPRRSFSYGRNYTYIMLRQLPWARRVPFLIWWFLIGERGATGVATAIWDKLVTRTETGAPPLGLATRAKLEGLGLWLKNRRQGSPAGSVRHA